MLKDQTLQKTRTLLFPEFTRTFSKSSRELLPYLGGAEMTIILSDNNSRIFTAP